MSYSSERKPHAVLIPYPVQGHINPLFKLAKLLHLRGFHITFVNTEYNHKRLLKSRGPDSLDGLPDFVFETIPDGLTPTEGDGDGDVSQDIPSLCESIKKNFQQYFHELLARLKDSATAGLIPPVTCLVSDCYLSFSIHVADELALPILLLSPGSASSFLSVLHFRTLFEKGLIPLKDESDLTNGYLDIEVDCIPGMQNFRLKDLPDFIRITDPNDFMEISDMSNIAERKPHAVLIPYPVQGHINPLFKLAKLLHLRGFHITFVNTEYNHKRLLKSRGPNALDGLPGFGFETIPDGLSPLDGDGDVSQNLHSLCDSIRKNFLQYFHELLARLKDSADAGLIPAVTCIVSDCFMPFATQAAEELALPSVIFFSSSACCFLSFVHFHTLFEKDIIPLKDESYLTNGYLDTKVDWNPGMQNFRLKDLPDLIRTTDPNELILQYVIDAVDKRHRASAIVFNTSNELESDIMDALSSMFPSLYTIGPFPSFLNQSPLNQLESLGSNLWKEDTNCLQWLESKEPGSVVYVNFGSLTVMSPEKLLEFAWGLANSKQSFLWIIRPDLVIGGSVVLSSEFVNEISDRGLIASRCPQEQVLNHPSVGGFLTHCGWNSTIESICAGVPMLSWPFYGDQTTNCRFICNEWEIGIEIDNNVNRVEVEKLINELMVGEKGKKMRQKTMDLKRKLDEDTRPGGSSYMNLDKVIKELLLKQN